MAEIHSENVEINEIINYMSNIPHIDGAESTDDEEESDGSPEQKRARVNEPERHRITTSRSFTLGTSHSFLQWDGGYPQGNSATLGVERPSRATSASPTGPFPRTSSPSDHTIMKDLYKDALIRDSFTNRITYMKGNWLRKTVSLRLAKQAAEVATTEAAGVTPSPSIPHGKKRRNNSESYDHSGFPSQSSPTTQSSTQQA